MAYISQDPIQATDYNNFASSVNALWGVGSGDRGYGQTSPAVLPLVTSTVTTVTAAQWSDLLARMNTIDQHQTATTTGLVSPTQGQQINIIASLGATIASLDGTSASRTTAFAVGTACIYNGMFNTTVWTTTATKEVSYTFPNADAMRHFFNAGGYIEFTGKNSTLSGNTKSTDWDTLLANAADVRIRANSSGKIGGSGSTAINNTSRGFYQLGTSYANANIILQQYSATATGSYTLNYVCFEARLNAAPGSATQIFLRMQLFDQSPDEPLPANSNNVQGNLILTTSLIPPSTTYINSSWGAVSNIASANVANIYPGLGTNTQS